MEQPQIRFQANRDMDEKEGKTFLPMVKSVLVNIAGNNTDQVILPVEAGTYVRAVAKVKTVVDGTTPTVDIGTASDADGLIANANFDCTTLNTVAESSGGIFFAAAGAVTMDVGGSGTAAGAIEVVFELYNMTQLLLNPHQTIAIAGA